MYIFIYVSMYVFIYMYMCVYVCIYVYIYIFIHICICIWIYIPIYIYMYGGCRGKEQIRIYLKIRRSTRRFVFFEFIYLVLAYVLYICMFPACCFRQRTYVAQCFFNGAHNETWTHSCFHYKWPLVGQTGLYKGCCSSFLECVYFNLLYLSLIFDMFIVVCVC